MWFKEKSGASVDVISVGTAETEATLRKALAIGADNAIRVNATARDAQQVAKEIVAVMQENSYDLVIAGRESIDYNGGMVPGMIAALTGMNYLNNCIGLEIEENQATAIREMDGGKETITSPLPLVIGAQKGLVEESDLRIPNMRGIMMARKKPLTVVEPTQEGQQVQTVSFEKPAPKGAVKLVDPENIDELISLLHNEAKVI
jgi:electron transfer flavoprotein beta subunit